MKNVKQTIILLVLCVVLASCAKEDVQVVDEPKMVSVNVEAMHSSYANPQGAEDPLATSAIGPLQAPQVRQLAWGKNQTMTVTVTPQQPQIERLAASPSPGTKITRSMANGVKYRVMAFDESRKLVSSQVFTHGYPVNKLSLESGKVYTILAISFNDKRNILLPEFKFNESLEELVLDQFHDSDLMVDYIEDFSVDNPLGRMGIEFEHVFTQVKVKLESTVGPITEVSDLAITNAYREASVRIGRNPVELFFPSHLQFDYPIQDFAIFNPTLAQSSEHIVYVKGNESHSLLIKQLGINGVVKSNLRVDNLILNRGTAYNINITLKQ